MIYDNLFVIPDKRVETVLALQNSGMPFELEKNNMPDSDISFYSVSIGNCIPEEKYIKFLLQSELAIYSQKFCWALFYKPELAFDWIMRFSEPSRTTPEQAFSTILSTFENSTFKTVAEISKIL